MILVQNFMLINNYMETWVWQSPEMKLLTLQVVFFKTFSCAGALLILLESP